MDKKLEQKKVELFWDWFEGYEARIRDVVEDHTPYEREAVVRDLDDQILEFGMFTWEIGLGSARHYYLIISPNGDQQLLTRSRLIIQSAPDLPFWEFHFARPVKEWDLKFSLFDDMMNEHHVNASEWKFVLYQDRNNGIDVLIQAGNMVPLDTETKWTAGNMVVTSLIGEECRINNVNKIEIIDRFENLHSDPGTDMVYLKSSFDKILVSK